MNNFSQSNIASEIERFFWYEEFVNNTFLGLGFLGNLFMFAVYSQKSFRKLSISTYFRYISIACTCHFAYLLLQYFVDLSIKDTNLIACRLISFVSSIFTPIAAWLDVFATLDRFLVIVYPSRFHALRRRSFQIKLTIAILIYNILFYSSHLFEKQLTWTFYFDIQGQEKLGSICLGDSDKVLNAIDFLNATAVPFSIMFLSSVTTLVALIRVRCRAVVSSAMSSLHDQRSHRKRVRDVKFCITIIFINMMFLVFNLPYRLNCLVDINPFDYETQTFSYAIFVSVLVNFSDFYYSFIFFVQLLVNSLVRSELVRMMARFVDSIISFGKILTSRII